MEENLKQAAAESLSKQTQAIAQQPKEGINTIADLLNKHKQQIQAALPKHLTADRLIRVALTAMSKNPNLLKCTPKSLFGAVIQAAQLGLEPDSPLGHAYMIPYKRNFKDDKEKWHSETNIQFIIGYRGLLDLARRSGQIESLVAMPVYEKDQFSYEYGTGEHLKHIPALTNRGNLTHVYAYAKIKDGGFIFEVMTKEQVDAIRARSKAADQGPWVTDYIQMARKTLIIRLCKYLPLSIELAQAVEITEADEAGKDTIDYNLEIEEAEIIKETPVAAPVQEKPKGKKETKKAVDPDEPKQLSDFLEHIETIDNDKHLSNYLKKYEKQIAALSESQQALLKSVTDDKFAELTQNK